MGQYISKAAVVAEIERRLEKIANASSEGNRELSAIHGAQQYELINLVQYINTLEVKNPYEQCVQYDSIKAGIQAHAETYSFNIESELFQQLTKEQQKLWRKEIEQAVISGGEMGVELARDPCYKENVEVKEVDLEKEVDSQTDLLCNLLCYMDELSNGDSEGVYPLPRNVIEDLHRFAKHFFELEVKSKGFSNCRNGRE